MKNIIFFLFGILVVISCSTSSDDNGNSNTSVVPVSPTNLIGTAASPTQINLSWTDNSTNETGFKIDRKVGSGNWVTDYGIVNNADVINFSDTSVSAEVTYSYRVSSFNSVGKSLTYSNEVTLTPTAAPVMPTLTTTAASSITLTTATSGGNISSDGGATITARGVCWSTSPNPTIALSTKTTDGSGSGAFTSNITGLTANTTYYVRAYATNSIGTAYGNEINFTTLQNSTGINIAGPNVTDIDGNMYQSITNCGITFIKQNLNVSKYSDGTTIPEVQDNIEWGSLTTGAWCYYQHNTANGAIYGKLYNWYAVMGIYDAASLNNASLRKKLAPTGWHIPTDSEWDSLINCLDPNADGGNNTLNVAGGKMKSTGTSLWYLINNYATNESGFTGLPGGYRTTSDTHFSWIGTDGFWWSSSEYNTSLFSFAYIRYLTRSNHQVYRGYDDKQYGYSVRCVKD
jgi:uncharacterized protein (TIGR02145 family)